MKMRRQNLCLIKYLIEVILSAFLDQQNLRVERRLSLSRLLRCLKNQFGISGVESNVIENVEFNRLIDKYRECLQRVNGYLGHAG